MKIKSEIECKCAARATLSEDGGLSVKVTVSAIYDAETGASTSVDIEVPEEETKIVGGALVKAIKACESRVHDKIMDAISTSRKVGQTLGEIQS
jgi:hypothetical protein